MENVARACSQIFEKNAASLSALSNTLEASLNGDSRGPRPASGKRSCGPVNHSRPWCCPHARSRSLPGVHGVDRVILVQSGGAEERKGEAGDAADRL